MNMDQLQQVIDSVQDFMWTYINIALLVACALYFTIRTRGIQFRMIVEMVRMMLRPEKPSKESEQKHISSFQAFVVALASRIGTGNMAGVATAISVGGPGSIFWMWVMALFGSATAYVESTLAQLYKRRGKHSFFGGPAYYMKYGLHSPAFGVVFSVLMILTFGWANNASQSNTIALACEQAFRIPVEYMGIALTVLALIVVFGGIHRIARVSEAVVPFMAILYLFVAIVVIVMNFHRIPTVFTMIVENAFGFGPFAGGSLGTIVAMGVKRGLFSNEAGEGSAPNAAATATVSHPVKQGLIQALGVYTDTLVVCSCTAFIILCSGVDYTASNGIQLTQDAMTAEIGSLGNPFVAITIWMFAFSTIITNFYYGETNLLYFTRSKVALYGYRAMSCGFVMFGALMSLELTWSIIDLCMALITICNLTAIVLLYPKVHTLTKDYVAQRRMHKDPVFRKATMPEIADQLEGWE
jgi:AGCS family alanine or glycine:cation symporter